MNLHPAVEATFQREGTKTQRVVIISPIIRWVTWAQRNVGDKHLDFIAPSRHRAIALKKLFIYRRYKDECLDLPDDLGALTSWRPIRSPA